MTLTERIEAFSILGNKITNLQSDELEMLARRAQVDNHWFTLESVQKAFEGLSILLEKDKLTSWTEKYDLHAPEVPKIVGIIMAGNIPLVGFHDLLCVLISGHFAAVKASSQDTFLSKTIIEWIVEIEPRFKKNLEIRERLTEIDALIATGSDNTARYFEYYFKDHPKIIRKNRTSAAVLDGTETTEELKALGQDIFTFYGLGCRNVSKVFVPEGYDPTLFFESIQGFEGIANNHKYQNNYDYNKSILLINGVEHLDTGFLLWQPSENLVSPISVLFSETYKDEEDLNAKLMFIQEKLQCIVSKNNTPFGKAQSPELWDYADNVDTVNFLISL